MAFKISDLMISLAGEEGRDEIAFSTCSRCNVTWGVYLAQGPGQTAALPQISSPETSAASLASLKEQLKQQIAQIEKEEAALEKRLTPQTLEEVDLLTEKLNSALDALSALRTEMTKK